MKCFKHEVGIYSIGEWYKEYITDSILLHMCMHGPPFCIFKFPLQFLSHDNNPVMVTHGLVDEGDICKDAVTHQFN